MIRLVFAAALALVCLTARPAAADVYGVVWPVVEIGGVAVPEGVRPTVEFNRSAGGRAFGSTGCNQWSAPLTRGDDGTLRFGRAISTRRACLDERAAETERRFLAALEGITTLRRDRGAVVLDGAGGAIVLRRGAAR